MSNIVKRDKEMQKKLMSPDKKADEAFGHLKRGAYGAVATGGAVGVSMLPLVPGSIVLLPALFTVVCVLLFINTMYKYMK